MRQLLWALQAHIEFLALAIPTEVKIADKIPMKNCIQNISIVEMQTDGNEFSYLKQLYTKRHNWQDLPIKIGTFRLDLLWKPIVACSNQGDHAHQVYVSISSR